MQRLLGGLPCRSIKLLPRDAGVPSILEALLPGKALLSQRLWLRNLLLLPPPPTIATAIHSACQLLTGLAVPLPYYPVMTTHTIAMKLLYKEASDAFFRDLRTVLAATDSTVRDPALTLFAEAVMVPTNLNTASQRTLERLIEDCRWLSTQTSVSHRARLPRT